MKRFLLSVVLATTLALTSCQFDDSDIWNKFGEMEESIRDHEQRISALEELCKQMNTNIEALQTLVNALEKRDYITNISPIREDGEVVGYAISFGNSDTITIYNGKDGADGYTPQIGVKQDTDGIYYWTLDGEWLLDADGNKIQANGVNGTDGITPQLKIENDYWYVSYDNGATWEKLGNASSGSGSSNCVITKVEESETEVVFTLSDGSTITLPKGEKAEVVSENNKIYYTTTDGKKLFPKTAASLYGAILISNTYKDGQGILIFDDAITSIGSSAFSGCTSLTSVTIPGSVTSIGGSAFSGCTSLTSVTIPDSVTSIGDYAFRYCESLTSITIPDSVTSIGGAAFAGCKGLTSVTIGNSVTSIGGSAFDSCTSLTSVIIPDSVTSIGDYAFRYCESLTSITIPDSVTSIGNYAFENCTSLTSVTIGNSVTSIGNYAFENCTSLTSVTIPDSVTSIGEYTFSNCASLTDTYVNITDLATYATSNNTNLLPGYKHLLVNGTEITELVIPDSVTSIGYEAFLYCSSLTSITIPDSVTSIGDWAFLYCSSLTSVTIGNSVTSIGYGAFYGCSSLTSVTIPDSVTSIEYGTFYDCSSLTSITIPDSVTSIGEEAFCRCSSLTSVTIPDSVTLIGGEAFAYCSSLTSVYCKPTTPPTGDSYMFSYYDSGYKPIGCKIYVPRNSVEAYKAAQYWSDYASDIVGYDF